MGCGSSSASHPAEPLDAPELSWKLWNALDIAEEADKTKLARFFSRLKSKGAKNLQDPTPEDLELTLPLELAETGGTGLILTEPLAPGSGRDLLKYFGSGLKLHMRYAVIVVRSAVAVLRNEPNVVNIPGPTQESPVVVVGDLHGSLPDLICILEKYGWPSKSQRYVFNGDFVDRGTQGCEVLLVLLCLKALFPDEVFLIRGNHEDATISAAYGFKEETVEKFSETMFNVFVSAFMALPLCAVIGQENGMFVVHAGLFRDDSVGFDEIEAVDRFKYASMLCDEVVTNTYDDTIVEDMTWSDPTNDPGIHPNDDRGAGVFYGPDIVTRFLSKNNLKTLVRSHEAMCQGSECVEMAGGFSYWTVFSASNYSGSGNRGAVLCFTGLIEPPEVFKYRSTAAAVQLDVSNLDRLEHFIARRHFRLLKGFEAKDPTSSGEVSAQDWAAVMGSVLEMNVDFAVIRPTLLGVSGGHAGGVCYNDFLSHYNLGDDNMHQGGGGESQFKVANLYDNYPLLNAAFVSWDVNHDGCVDRAEFVEGVRILNEELSPENQIDALYIFDIIDLDHSGEIDLNEFCESYRLVRNRPGDAMNSPTSSTKGSGTPPRGGQKRDSISEALR